MIRNYNGVKNRKAILYLRTLCEIKSENMESLSDALKKEGVVSFYSYDMPQLITFKSEEEISQYLQKKFLEEVKRYIGTEKINDYFTLILLKLLKENGGVFPNSKKMEKIEKAAEKLRLATSKEERKSVEPLQMLLREILEFSEEIMERKREELIENIFPHEYELYIHTKNLHGKIIWNRWEGRGDQSDYCFLTSSITGGTMIIDCSFDGTVNVYKRCYSGYNRKIRMNTKEKANLISIHRELALLASEVGLKFESEVDYNQITN